MHMDNNIDKILAVRKFSRFYTRFFGLLGRRMHDSPYSLIEARVLWELSARTSANATEIACDLKLDNGYMSRILKKLEARGLVEREQCPLDGRAVKLTISEHGMLEAATMADKANTDVAEKIADLSEQELDEITKAMQLIEAKLTPKNAARRAAIIRSHRSGDIGWVVKAHGEFYENELGFNEKFEALVARIAADFICSYDAKTEHCWIAELNGKNVGSIFLVREDDNTAKLRLLYVDAEARGLGLGKQLVAECLHFAKAAGYARVVLWTNAVLTTARHIYEEAGFHLISEDTHSDFGEPQVGQNWVLEF